MGLARLASAPSSGAVKVALLCHLADQERAPSPVRGVAKARQMKGGLRNDTFLDKASTALSEEYAERIDSSAPCPFCFSLGDAPVGKCRQSSSRDSCKVFNSANILEQLDG